MTGTGALWRIEYQADATRSNSLRIPIGYMLEADWSRQARWLGLIFRTHLTRSELDVVNLKTWPELEQLEGFMTTLFTRAWEAPEGLGSSNVAKSYPVYTALHFAPEPLEIDIGSYEPPTFQELYASLLGQKGNLTPVAIADVVPLKRKPKRPFVQAPEAVELMNKAA